MQCLDGTKFLYAGNKVRGMISCDEVTGNWIFVLLQLLCYNRADKVIAHKELERILGAFLGAFL